MGTTNIISGTVTARADFATNNNGRPADAVSQSFDQVLSNVATPKGVASSTPVTSPKKAGQASRPVSPQATNRNANAALSRGQQPTVQEPTESETSTGTTQLPFPPPLTAQRPMATPAPVSQAELNPLPIIPPKKQGASDAPTVPANAPPSASQPQTPALTDVVLPVVLLATGQLAPGATHSSDNGATEPVSHGAEPADSPLTELGNFLDASPQAGVTTASPVSAKIAANVAQGLRTQPDAVAQPTANALASAVDLTSLPQSDPSIPVAGPEAATASESPQHMNFIATTFHAAASLVSSTTQMMFTANEFGAAKMPTAQPPATTAAAAATLSVSNTQNSPGGGTDSGPNEHSSSEPTPTAPTANNGAAGIFAIHPADSGIPMQALNPVAIAASPVGLRTAESSSTNNSTNAASDSSGGSLSQASTQPDDSSANSLLPASGGVPASGQVSQARLIDNSRGEEMRVSLDTDTLGPIELRAISDKDRIGAVITAVKPETQEFLNTDLPSLHQALSDRNLQVQQISVSQGSLAGGMSGRGAFSQTGNPWQEQAPLNYWRTTEEGGPSGESSPSAMAAVAVPGRLSVHV
jgi:flagellar hook-length control protein FliK